MPPARPWTAWLALCLVRQRERQAWLRDIEREHLREVDADEGEVPRASRLRYEYHGSGLCLSGPDHEILDVDSHGDVDPYFFARRVLSLDPRPVPEAHLVRWLTDAELIVAALDDLRREGLIHHPESRHIFRLSDRLEAIARERAAALAERDDRDEPDAAETHRRWLRSLLDDRGRAARVLPGAARVLGARACVPLLAGPIDAATGQALEVLHAHAGEPCPEIEPLLDRLDPKAHHPYAAWAAAQYLLARGIARERAIETVLAFAAVETVAGYRGNPFLDKLALLLLEHAPDLALPWVRRALRSSTPVVVAGMAAALVLLDEPWCLDELESALRDKGPGVTEKRYIAAALERSVRAPGRGRDLAPPPPVHDASAPGYSLDEVIANSMDNWLPGDFAAVREVIERVKARRAGPPRAAPGSGEGAP